MTEKKDPLQQRIEAGNWVILALFSGAGLFLAPGAFTGGIIGGGLLGVANFHWLGRDLAAVFNGRGRDVKKSVMLRYFLRLAVSAFILWLLISQEAVDVFGLVVGLSVVPLNIIVTACWAAAKGKNLAGAR